MIILGTLVVVIACVVLFCTQVLLNEYEKAFKVLMILRTYRPDVSYNYILRYLDMYEVD